MDAIEPDDAPRDEPQAVRLIREALSQRLGRPAVARGGKGRVTSWVVSDPCFAWIQQGSKGPKSYRSGILVTHEIVKFYNEHSRSLGEILKENLKKDPRAILRAAEVTPDLREAHALIWSSKAALESGDEKAHTVFFSEDWEEFHGNLERVVEKIPDDLFPKMPNTGKTGGEGIFRGTLFCLELAHPRHLESTDKAAARDTAERIVKGAWELFACYYPWERMRWRSTDLARFMRSAGINEDCEHLAIEAFAGGNCEGRLEAAHIKPDAHGGSDNAWNGLWLCQKHHRQTEGRLKGQRDKRNLSIVSVRFG